MSKIPFDPTTTQGLRRRFRTISPPSLLTGWLLAATFCLGFVTVHAQETVNGKPGRANFRSVINFKGTAFLEQRQGRTNVPPHAGVPPFPKGAPGFSDAAPQGMQPASISPAPEARNSVAPASVDAVSISGMPSPPMSQSFPALDDNGTVIPPDTHGAVGPNHIMTVLNSQFRIQDRNGTNLSTLSFNAFWASLGVTILSDPKVLYDPYADRWMSSALAQPQSSASSVLIGVSQTSDPTGVWNLYRVDADTNNLAWIDFPSIGFNKDWIVVSGNMFANFFTLGQQTTVNIWAFNKTNLYSGGVGLYTLLQDPSGRGFTMVPAVTFDQTLATMYLVENDQLLQNLFGSGSFLRVSTITGPLGSERLVLGRSFVTATNAWFNLDPFVPGLLPQLGTNFGIDGGDARMQNVVYRNGNLWCTHHVFLPASFPTHAAVQWWQFTPEGQLLQFGRIDDPTEATSYAYPSIAVNRCEDVLIGFSSFSTNQFASASYAFRKASDPPNTLNDPAFLKPGEAPYYKTFVPPPFIGVNRWGDYSATVVDPVNDLDMWTIQEYAASPNPLTGESMWGTWWGKLNLVGSSAGRIEFFSSSFTANEAPPPGFATITVLNIGGGPGSVDYFTSDGTAIAGLDYRPVSGTLTFASGQTEATFPIEIIDNPDPGPDKTILLTLTNVQGGPVFGCLTNAVVKILDDETRAIPNTAGEFNFSSYINYGLPYQVTENESDSQFSFISFCQVSPNPDRLRSPMGALITVVRTNGATGRCLVDYATLEGGTATPFVDYIPTSGTLVFDDYQMSANFLVPVLSDSFFTLFSEGSKFLNIVLSNPRLDTNEVVNNPLLPQPSLGAGSVAGLWIYSVNDGFCTVSLTGGGLVLTQTCALGFSFERLHYHLDEYPNRDPRNPGGLNFIDVSVILSSTTTIGGNGAVRVIVPNLQTGTPIGWFLTAGSDHLQDPAGGSQVWPNPIITDTSFNIITNFSDFDTNSFTINFSAPQCRFNFRLWFTNDTEVEFNEDLYLELRSLPGNPPVNFEGAFANISVLYDDQPAGALDREWNPDNVEGTPDQSFNQTPGANNTVRAVAVQGDLKAIIGGDFTRYNSITRNHIVRLNADGSMDRSFNPGNGANDSVQAVYVYPTNSPFAGRILAAGNFASYDGFTRHGIVRLMPTGAIDPSFTIGNGAGFGSAVGPIYAMAVQADGKIVIAGDFTEFNDINRNGVARLNTNGTLDLTFDARLAADGPLWTVALTTNINGGENILVAGEFGTFDGQNRSGIVQLLPDGTVDPNFDPGGGTDAGVYAIGVQTNGTIVIAGAFNMFDARIRNKVARLNSDGSLDETFSPAIGPDLPVYSMVVQPDQKAVIGGLFTDYNGTRRRGMARLKLDGSLDTTFMDTAYNQFAGFTKPLFTDSPDAVFAMAMQPDGNFMVGGSFDTVGGNPSYLMRLRNSHTVFTRNDKRTRMNVARILGGLTPGPGNAEFDTDNYFVDENGRTASLRLRRVDGRLGTLVAEAATTDRTAYQGIDYAATNLVSVWPEGFYQTNINITFPIVFPTNFTPISVGSVEANYLQIPILDDLGEEGDEQLDLSFIRPSASITLGGEVIPLGGALGRSSSRLTIADNDFPRGTFNFLQPVFFTNELARSAIITVVRTNGSAGRVTVDWMLTTNVPPPRATPGLDYTNAVRGTLTFNAGVTSRTFTVSINQDSELEFDENIGLILTNATSGARLPGGLDTSTATAILTIIDNNFPPGRINFGLDNFTFNETDGEATITVTRSGGSESQVSVDYQTINSIATAPSDYTAVSGTLSWDAGDTAPKTFKVPLFVDGQVEGTENVRLRLFNPLVRGLTDTNLLGQRASATLTILDGDSYGSVAFRQPFYQVDENGGFIEITVFRSGGISGSGTLQYSTLPDTAIPGQDYVPVSGTLTFGPGEIGKTFLVPIIDDTQSDGNTTLFLQLSSPVNLGLGLPSTVVLSIVDNESFREPPGDLDVAFRADTKANGPVYAIAPQYAGGQIDGRLMVAGDFTEFNDVTRNRMARLLTNGTLDTTFNPGVGANASIRALAMQKDGKILIGGFFTSVVHTNRSGIARLNYEGTLDEAFNPGAAADVAAIYSIALQPDDKILVAGGFSKFNNQPSPGIVRLTTNGIVDKTFDVGGGADAAVYVVAIQNDGKILIGGDFQNVNGFTSPRLARLNRNGSIDTSFNFGLGCDGAVRAIAVQPDGKIVIGGSFTRVGNTPRNFIARLEQNGDVDTTFLNSDIGADNAVYALGLQVDGRIVVVGDFTRFNDVGRNRITRVMPDGSTDTSINFGAGTDSFISALYLQPDRKIVIGGGFTTYDEKPRLHIARLYGGTVAGPGGLEFSQPEYSVDENGTNTLITVRRRGGTAGVVGASFRTVDGTAIAGQDYVATNGFLTFPHAETEQKFLVRILDNFVPNEDRLARLELFNYTGGVTNGPKPTSRLVIRNDEVLVGFVNTNYVTSEGVASGLQNIAVRRTLGSNTAFSIQFETSSGSAASGLDFVPTNGTLTFLPNELTKSFQVPIVDDSLIEGTESLNLRLFNPSAKTFLNLDRATLEIHDNDFAPGQLSLSTSNIVVDEGGGYVDIAVIRTNGSTGFITVQLATLDITAQSGLDYVGTNTTIAFADGETVKVFRIPILIDFISEANEQFSVSIFNPIGTTLGNPSSAIVTINNNDRPYGTFLFSTNFKAFVENGGFAPLTIYRINGSLNTVTVNLITASGTATAGQDFTPVTTTLTFPPGLTNMIVPITLLDDTLQEGSENFTVSLSNPSSGAALGVPSTCTVQIIDNDSPILIPAGATLISETISNGVIDVGERVTLRLGIRNIGFTNTQNLIATVQNSGGVLNPSPVSASYGVVQANGPTNFQNFALTANVTNNGLLTVTLALTNNGQNLGTVAYTFRVGSTTYTFVNSNRITINSPPAPGSVSNATPYPSSIIAADVFGTITKVTATLRNITHTYPGDIDILLVSPAGDTVVLMSDAGQGFGSSIENVTIRYTDSAPSAPPFNGLITSGDCLPVNYADDQSQARDFFPPPAPAATNTWPTTMATFNGKNANGTWSLYIVDDLPGDDGFVADGWSLSITASTPVNDAPPTLQFIGMLPNGDLRMSVRGQPGVRYALQASENLLMYTNVHSFTMPNGGVYYYEEPRSAASKFFRAAKNP